MAQLDRSQRRGDSPKTNSPTMEQLLREGEGSWWPPAPAASSCSSPSLMKNHDPEEDHIQPRKKSVLSKVKEKARKLKHSLSVKKRHNEDENTTPSWGVSLEEDDTEEEDAEYLGAPMYESELAPESYKETARQHQRTIPVLTEKHALPTTGSENDDNNNKENPLSPTKDDDKVNSSPQKTIPETMSQRLAPALGTVTQKLGPAYASVADATHAIASKIQGLTVLDSSTEASQTKNTSPLAPKTSPSARTASPHTFSGPLAPQHLSSHGSASTAAASPLSQSLSSPEAQEPGKHVSSTSSDQQVWDKGVSVKEYLMNKFEPGEDERALSRAISDAMSPKKTPSDVSVVDKVREAVTSLLRNNSTEQPTSKPAVLTRSVTKAPSHVSVSNDAHEVGEEKNHGRILQTN